MPRLFKFSNRLNRIFIYIYSNGLIKNLKEIIYKKKKSEREIIDEVFKELEQNKDTVFFKGSTYKFIKKLGSKLFGTVYLVEDQRDFKRKALKQINQSISEDEVKIVLREIDNLKNNVNPYVINFVDHFILHGRYCIVWEYCENGDLATLIDKYKKKNQTISSSKAFQIFIQLMRALNSLHNVNKIIHRNIKPANIFFDLNKIKIGDLGVAVNTDTISKAYTAVGSPLYVSPEIAKYKPYTNKTDVWSAGIVIFEVITLKRPFTGRTRYEVYKSIINDRIDFDLIPEDEDKIEIRQIKPYLKKMLEKEDTVRSSSSYIYKQLEAIDQRIKNQLSK